MQPKETVMPPQASPEVRIEAARVSVGTTVWGTNLPGGGMDFTNTDRERVLVFGSRDYPTPVLEQPLCRPFAELCQRQEESAYLEFARMFGPLGIDAEALEAAGIRGEPLSVWAEQSQRVDRLLRAWDALRGKADSYGETLLMVYTLRGNPTTKKGIDRPAAVKAMAVELTEELSRCSSPSITGAYEGRAQFALTYAPRTLQGAIWIQCASILTEAVDYRRCRNCNEWLVLGFKKGMKKHAEFHDDACRAAFRQTLIRRAGELHKSGIPLAEIARQLDRTVADLRKWKAQGWRTSVRRSGSQRAKR